jgi:uncharacterized radical SAM superfamily protein
MGIIVVKPFRTLPLSITGDSCSLLCDHCKAIYLKNMFKIFELNERLKDNYKSILVSGGFDKEGKIPYIPIEIIKQLKEKGLKLNFHLGLINEEILKEILNYIDEVSYDLILDDEVIKNIFHLDKTSENYKKTFELLYKYVSISPHIILGINKGKIKNEYAIIEYLERFKIKKLIFIIFTPLKNTPLEKLNPPSIDELKDFFLFARKRLPKIDFYLGCVRPKGDYREKIDFLAYDMGFKAIVNPHFKLIEYLNKNKKIEGHFEECCALLK